MLSIKRIIATGCVALSMAGVSSVAVAAAKVDAALPDYQKSSGVSGNLSSVGSDTLANLMTLWTEEGKRAYLNGNIQVQAAVVTSADS